MTAVDGVGDVDRRASAEEQPGVLDARLLPAMLCCWGATIAAVTAGWVAGVVLAAGLVVLAIGLWVLLLWSMAHRRERWRGVAVVALAAVLLGAGFAVAAAWREYRVQTHPLRSTAGATSVMVVATPVSDPKPVRSSGFGDQRWVVRGNLREYRRGASVVRTGGAVVILASGEGWARLSPGQAVEFRARAEQPPHRDLTVVMLRAQGPPVVVGSLPWWQRVAGTVRTALAGASSRALSADSAGLLPALVVGDTFALPEHVREDFEIAGLEHLCVVSGANFTILLTAVLFVVRLLTLGPRAAAAVAAAALLMFVIVARPDPSVLRAAAMGAITLLALVTGRRKQALPALCAAIIALLALWPELAVRAGFALSAIATGGLILLAPSWADWLRARGWRRVPAEIVAVSAAAFVVTTPLMIALTGRVSMVAILANCLVEPVIAPITVLGATGAVLSCLWPPLADVVLRCAAPPLWWLLSVAEHAAAVPGAELTVPGGALSGITACAVFVAIILALRCRLVRRVAVVVAVAVAAVLIPIRIWHPGWPPGDWVLAACAVGQGDALALSLGNGAAVVIDVGPHPRPIDTCLTRLGITTIPLLILTHPHADHIGGLPGALQNRHVSALAVAPNELDGLSAQPRLATGVQGESVESRGRVADERGEAPRGGREPVDGIEQVVEVAAAEKVPLIELSEGQVLAFAAVELTVLAPAARSARLTRPPGTDGANDRSIVIAATTSAGRILLTGDIEAPAQQSLLRSGAELRADILKVPHHGSRTTTKEFLTAVRPRLALVTVGADNTFGHPHPALLAELSALGATVARTDEQGDILVMGAGPTLRTLHARPPNSS
ncbi:ComEC/Rec2 family competence protein [Nocardia sp. NPDC052566]|uniref:ComEC/Rec2 family competence protein n=1 Tax=Nocardia sp. NPDC052566 TaxID=3364330 RepID=UPI0037C7DAC3